MRPTTLADWLDYQQCQHPCAIALGLERVRALWRHLGEPLPAPLVVTVGGTNGKGSTVAFLEAMLGASGRRVGAYTSPHLVRYNERIRVAGVEIDDESLIRAFERIEAARGDTPLTYFEFGTLAALLVFAASRLDVALLEVGLGGRLDAVNLVDADAAIVSTIGLDHQDWLGADRDSIGREKAGIARAGRPLVIGETDPPAGLIAAVAEAGARLVRAGHDYRIETGAHGRWIWSTAGERLDLPPPALAAPCQPANAAAAIAVLHALRERLGWEPAAIAAGVAQARLAGRLQRLAGEIELIVDVAHNPQAAAQLAAWLAAHPPRGADRAVFSALGDKDIAGIVAPLRTAFAHWHLAGLRSETPRGLDSDALAARLASQSISAARCSTHASLAAALDAACAASRPGDRVLAFGSFYVAAAAMAWADARSCDGRGVPGTG